jgi:hypothetical protein
MEHVTFGHNNGLRVSALALVPVIGPRTVDQTDSYLAALDVKLDDDQYLRLAEVSRIDLGQPHIQIAVRVSAPWVAKTPGSPFPACRVPRRR